MKLLYVSCLYAALFGETKSKTKLPTSTQYRVKGLEVSGSVAQDEMYAGYLPLDLEYDYGIEEKLFFWLVKQRTANNIESTEDTSSAAIGARKKLVIWLNGTPGCSSLTDLFRGLGPFTVHEIATTAQPSSSPQHPTIKPSKVPSVEPTKVPSLAPTCYPSSQTSAPSLAPSDMPTDAPVEPSVSPSEIPTGAPSPGSQDPTSVPTIVPSTQTLHPTTEPTVNPSISSTVAQSTSPSIVPSVSQSTEPSAAPSDGTTSSTSPEPTSGPTTFNPTLTPSVEQSATPTITPTTRTSPTITPTTRTSTSPTTSPSAASTTASSTFPTTSPTLAPSAASTTASTTLPTNSPSLASSQISISSGNPSISPPAISSLRPSADPQPDPNLSFDISDSRKFRSRSRVLDTTQTSDKGNIDSVRAEEDRKMDTYSRPSKPHSPATDPRHFSSSSPSLLPSKPPLNPPPKFELRSNPYAWNIAADMLFLDEPLGTGFSDSEFNAASSTTGSVHQHESVQSHHQQDKDTVYTTRHSAESILSALRSLLRVFPDLANSDVYIAGDGYAGLLIPVLADVLLNYADELYYRSIYEPRGPWRDNKDERPIRLKGLLIGHSMVDLVAQESSYAEYVYSRGLISSSDKLALGRLYDRCISNAEGTRNKRVRRGDLTKCSLLRAAQYSSGGVCTRDTRNFIQDAHSASDTTSSMSTIRRFLNDPGVQTLLHVRETDSNAKKLSTPTWRACNELIGSAYDADPFVSSVSTLQSVSEHISREGDGGIRVLLYAGEYSLVGNHLGIQRTLDQHNWLGRSWSSSKRALWRVGEENESGQAVAGVYQSLRDENFAFLQVRHSGQLIPLDAPFAALDLLSRFIHGRTFRDIPLPLSTSADGEVSLQEFTFNVDVEFMAELSQSSAESQSNNQQISGATILLTALALTLLSILILSVGIWRYRQGSTLGKHKYRQLDTNTHSDGPYRTLWTYLSGETTRGLMDEATDNDRYERLPLVSTTHDGSAANINRVPRTCTY